MVVTQRREQTTIITLLPNCSASWAHTRLFLCLLCGTTLTVGLLWAWVGVWIILPFAGLEAGLAAYIIYRVCQKTYRRQVVTCRGDSILVESGSSYPQRRWTFSRSRSRLTLSEPSHVTEAPQLNLCDRKQRIELGDFLTETDKRMALDALREQGLNIGVYQETSEAM